MDEFEMRAFELGVELYHDRFTFPRNEALEAHKVALVKHLRLRSRTYRPKLRMTEQRIAHEG